MAHSNVSTTKAAAPYPGWGTLKNWLATMAGKELPSRIDKSVVGNMSGSAKSELRTALRFLGWIDDKYVVTARFRDVMKTYGTDEWSAALGKTLDIAYVDVLEGINIEGDTLSQLEARFRSPGGLSGPTVVSRAVRFWLLAMQEAGRKVSPYFGAVSSTPNTAAPPKPRPRAAAKAKQKTAPNGSEAKRDDPNATELEFPVLGKGTLRIVMPAGMTADDWTLVNAYLMASWKTGKAAKTKQP